FVVVDLLPDSGARQLLGPDASPAQVAALERALGLDRPAWRRYAGWLGGALQGDLGESLATGEKAAVVVGDRSPRQAELVAVPGGRCVGRGPRRWRAGSAPRDRSSCGPPARCSSSRPRSSRRSPPAWPPRGFRRVGRIAGPIARP